MKINSMFCVLLVAIFIISSLPVSFAEETKQAPPEETPAQVAAAEDKPLEQAPPQQMEVQPEAVSTEVSLTRAQSVTLDFKEADIQNVLKIIAYKSGVNIVSTPDVIGNVTIRLVEVPWETALDVILKTYGFGYQRQGNIILVTKLENISKIQAEEPLQTEIFNLKFLDAQDAQKILVPLLSLRGKISVLYSRGQKGWQFGTFKIGKGTTSSQALSREQAGQAKVETISIEKNAAGDTISRKAEFEPSIKSKILVITDTVSFLDRIRNIIIPLIDKRPKQVIIEARLMEVNVDRLKDIGIDWGTGSAGANDYDTAPSDIGLSSKDSKTIAGRSLASEFTPSLFSPKETLTAFPGTYPYAAGLEVIFKKVMGTKFEAILHALEEDVNTNTLSAPRILTLDNQEASILVGYHTPILASTVTGGTDTTSATVTQSLDYYQEIGIRLNVVPQVNEDGYINMIIHPSVTSSSSSVTATSTAGNTTTQTSYPVIDVREAQTQILMKDGETIVIGGLLKDIKGKETIGIPFLSKIPILGKLFTREVVDNQKVDLLIFLTARVVKEGEFTPEQITELEKGMNTLAPKEEPRKKK